MMSRLREILQRKNERKAKLQACLASLITQLKQLGALKIVLFGSLAEDGVDNSSDLDLLILMPSTQTGKEWRNQIYDTVERGVAADIMVYNENEFSEILPTSRFLRRIATNRP